MIHFVVHEPADGVGVVVVEGVKAGTDLIGWVMDGDLTLNIKSESEKYSGKRLSISLAIVSFCDGKKFKIK